ncbi:hypothetical protein PTH_2504 [Pelotomaculum thermopropionicum SI]|uniref:Uncharacterized protein n=1 Tax=Pelotomaculum thermopropionicum (strain DSM 13744 / JCM 10971 / SI) TaxID=370438 RepID=A5CZB6_PELTS|nr:hypothetical protein PTH_2504 [Pelotomaculum thermopropionicum SI]
MFPKANELLEDMAKIGIIHKNYAEFFYYRWYRDDYYEWCRVKEVIATVNREGKNVVGITWNSGSPAKLLSKLIEKYRGKTQEVVSLHETVKKLTKPEEPKNIEYTDDVFIEKEGEHSE